MAPNQEKTMINNNNSKKNPQAAWNSMQQEHSINVEHGKS